MNVAAVLVESNKKVKDDLNLPGPGPSMLANRAGQATDWDRAFQVTFPGSENLSFLFFETLEIVLRQCMQVSNCAMVGISPANLFLRGMVCLLMLILPHTPLMRAGM